MQRTVFPCLFPRFQSQLRNKRFTCRVSPSHVISSAPLAFDDVHVSTRFWMRISPLCCVARPTYPRRFMMNLLLTCCLHNSGSTCRHDHNRSKMSSRTVKSEAFLASRVPFQHLLSRKHCEKVQTKFLRSFDVHVVTEHFAVKVWSRDIQQL